MDAQTESDMAQNGLFASNFEPIDTKTAIEIVEGSPNYKVLSSPGR